MSKKSIDPHGLQVLEYDQVLQVLSGFAASELGRQTARGLYPSTDAQWINRQLAQTSEMKALLAQSVRIPLAGLRDVGVILDHVGKKQTLLEPDELLAIADTLSACTRLQAFFLGLDAAQVGQLQDLAGSLEDFTDLVEPIDQCVENDQRLRDTASDKLQQIRHHIEKLENEIRERFVQMVHHRNIRVALENGNFLLRHGRPVLAVKLNYRSYVRGTVLDRSNSGSTLYIEPDELVELSNDLEDAQFEEKKEVDRILWELTHLVLARADDIRRNVKTLGWIDLTYAKARFSLAYDMSCPEISPDHTLALRQARHLLLLQLAYDEGLSREEIQTKVVPISPRLGDDFDLLLITGPNTGGKTVLLKTIGLCALMAQTGMHIPAAPGSVVPIYRQIFADIGDEQSIQQSLSTFSAHMRQIVNIIQRSNDHTLVLLDELGAGTDPTEGACLSTAILDALLACQAHSVATTHLGQLKTLAYARARAENASVQFDTDTLKPTYHLFIGTPGSSNALAIARRLGMPKTVLQQSQTLLQQQADGTTELINQVQKTRALAEHKRQKADSLLVRARDIRQQAAERLDKIHAEEKSLRQRAEHELERSMREIRTLTRDFRKQADQMPKPLRAEIDTLCERLLAVAADTPLAVRHQEFIDQLKRGDRVHVLPFRRDAIVDRIQRKRRCVVLLMEGKQIQTPFEQICRPERRSS